MVYNEEPYGKYVYCTAANMEELLTGLDAAKVPNDCILSLNMNAFKAVYVKPEINGE